VSFSDDDNDIKDDDDENEDFHKHDAQGCVYVQAPPPSSPPPPRVSSKVSGQIYNGRVIRDDTDDMVNHVVYNFFKRSRPSTTASTTNYRPSSPRRTSSPSSSSSARRRRGGPSRGMRMPWPSRWRCPRHLGRHRCSRLALHRRGHAAMPGRSPGTPGPELHLGGRQVHRLS
jgi:hypothetical protein